jgi:hypothetical protein
MENLPVNKNGQICLSRCFIKMFVNNGKPFILISFFSLLLLCGSQPVYSQGKTWREVTPAELQMKTPQVDADADAEAIFWEVRLDDKKIGKLSYNHYVRVKIFTERGREKFSKFDIPFYKGKKVEDVAARVIKPDGTIVSLQPGDIFEREIVRANKVKIKAKSFAIPNIEPGVIVEYQYKETFKNDSAGGERLLFQRDIPMQRVTYYVRPFKGLNLRFTSFNTPHLEFTEDKDRFYVGTMTNVPALKEEPYMPPSDEVRRWTLLSYGGSGYSWYSFSQQYGGLQALMSEPHKNIVKQAETIAGGAFTKEEKLKRIYTFVQTQIKNVSYDKSLTEDQLEKVEDIDNIEDILKARAGSSFHINLLFGAMASAVGFDAHLFFSSNRSEMFFNPEKVYGGSFLHTAGIAVATTNGWKYFDPGTPFLGFGDMFWHDQNVNAMVINKGSHSWVRTPMVGQGASLSQRTGKFKLLEDGTLEGEVRIEYAGNQAISRREGGFLDSATQREEEFKTEIKGRVSTAEISNLSIENFNDASQPIIYGFKVRIPGYAQKTGKRLFLQPNFFEYGSSPVFSSATRTHGIYFPYPWSESDIIEIELPKKFATDNADVPSPIEDPGKIASLKMKMSVDQAANVLRYERKFHFGGGGNIYFNVSAYQPLKNMFDAFHKADTHTITLKQN